jgi:hypothetical protein
MDPMEAVLLEATLCNAMYVAEWTVSGPAGTARLLLRLPVLGTGAAASVLLRRLDTADTIGSAAAPVA